jgi:formamidopyrimidine-DNA glycosylase
LLRPRPPPPGRTTTSTCVTTRGTLRLTDPRRFGAVVWSPALDDAPAAKLLARLGPEPFDPALTPALSMPRCSAGGAPIKAVLLAGDVVVGAGNIYACEALFQAGIDPRCAADRISRPRAARCWRRCAHAGARAGAGRQHAARLPRRARHERRFQSEAAVYGREGQPCLRCGTPGAAHRAGAALDLLLPGCQRR